MLRIYMSYILVVLGFTGSAFAQDAKQIIQRAEDAIKGKVSSHSIMEMTIKTPDYTRTMKMESWTSGTSKALVKILSPAREAGNRTLKLGNDIWMYLRNTETTIRIPPSMMLQSWNGSDYTYDDMVREETLTEDYSITVIGNEKIADVECWKLQLIPKPNAPVVWGKIPYWVRKADDLLAQVEYFDEKGQLMRTMVMSDFKAMGGRKVPAVWTMYNADKTHSTEIKMDDASFDVRIPDRIFSLKELEK
ncbi:MAG TPA: outer membrane lipoprotein-sorting protein [Candidatus Kryptobacter bacterium]|nr:MAG: outer membrane lipoprotein-sorting protein [Ignavibacteriae bacterium 37-53-5]HQT91479.1 outer membrane lipoprotein-sorting protein [Candidatus Kryptobacter bacterium]